MPLSLSTFFHRICAFVTKKNECSFVMNVFRIALNAIHNYSSYHYIECIVRLPIKTKPKCLICHSNVDFVFYICIHICSITCYMSRILIWKFVQYKNLIKSQHNINWNQNLNSIVFLSLNGEACIFLIIICTRLRLAHIL